jgi:hypothetical protein
MRRLPVIQVAAHSEPPRREHPMTKGHHRPVIGLLAIAMLCLATRASAGPPPPIADAIAKAYGLESFDRIDAIRYTFNVQVGAIKVSRSWVWEPKTNRVSYDGKDKAGKPVKVTYSRSELASQSAEVKDQVDPAFQNDQYWLLFPYHLVWDTGATVEDAGMQKLPLGRGSARRVVVTYPPQGGYTPGDVWELFVGSDDRVREMVYRRGGDSKPTVTASWQGYRKAGPLLVSTEHRGDFRGKKGRLHFSGVAVKLSGSNDWVNAR